MKASKLVVVSAGALGTPQILERSGVGGAELLKKLNIPVVSDVPGVGDQYQDHHLLLYPYKSSLDSEETLDGILSGRKDFGKAAAAKDPMLGWNAIGKLSNPRQNPSLTNVDVCAKLRLSPEEVKSLGPEFEKDWGKLKKAEALTSCFLYASYSRSNSS